MVPTTITDKRPIIDEAVAQSLKELAPDVERINYVFGQDWTGDWAVYFKVLLSDEASQEPNLRKVAPRVLSTIADKLDPTKIGMFPHFNFRSHSEQAERNEPAWA